MKISFENLGPLSTGKLNLADLTVICGENNTGKTYLTYALYGLLQTWDTFIKIPEFNLEPLNKNGILEINLEQEVVLHSKDILEKMTQDYCSNLFRFLSGQSEHFTKTILRFDLDLSNVLKKGFQTDFKTDSDRRIISFAKAISSSILSINTAAEKSNDHAINPEYPNFRYKALIDQVVKEICFTPVLPKPFIVSTERTGAVTFQSDLNLSRNRGFDLAREMRMESPDLASLLERVYSGGHPLPVTHNVDFINSLASIQAQDSKLSKSNPDILEDFATLIGGTYKIQSDVLHFVPDGSTNLRLRMSESSSSVRSLVILGYYLRHRAAPGDLLMIDEPELNLHPTNQRKLARLLARLVNAGIKVFVTTHSDYIIKEFNTLIMLNRESKTAKDVRKKWGYSERDHLAHNKVRVYMLKKDLVKKEGAQRKTNALKLCEASIDPALGIELPTFDETINEMNAIQEALYYGLDDGESK